MSMRFVYRIASMPAILPHAQFRVGDLQDEVLREAVNKEGEYIKRIPHIIFDNVAEFYAQHSRNEWHMKDDIPNWAPPFRSFFAEWNIPQHWVGHKPTDPPPIPGQMGYFVQALEVQEENRHQTDMWLNILDHMIHVQAATKDHRDKVAHYLQRCRWILACSFWSTVLQQPVAGRPIWNGLTTCIFVSPEGKWIGDFISGLCSLIIKVLPDTDALYSPLHVLGLGISFCHCKNVVKKEEGINLPDRVHRREKVPRLKFYTLNINPMREVLRREGQSESVGMSRALHICRGHFATYTPEHPLFGKYVGTFWRPDHVRGNEDNGKVIKNYSV